MKNRVTQLLDTKFPIALGGMAGISDATLAAAVSEAGGLGTIAGATQTGETLREEIDCLRHLTTNSFAVNIPLIISQLSDLISVVIEKKVPVVITAAGNPRLCASRLKEAGIRVLHVVPCADLARRAETAGVDAVIAEGFESGGFASPHEIGSLALIPQVVDAVKIPVIAAGGIADCRGYAACMVLGAEGASIGTAFLASVECTRISRDWKRQIIAGTDISTKIIGRGVAALRILMNSTAEMLEKKISDGISRNEIMKCVQTADSSEIDEGLYPCGQSVGLIRKIQTVKEIIDQLVYGSERLLAEMNSKPSSSK